MNDNFTAASDATPHWVNDTVVRNNVRVTIELPAALSNDNEAAAEHFDIRAKAGMFISFGIDTLGAHTDFAKGSNCASQVPYTTPYFAIVAASTAGVGGNAERSSLESEIARADALSKLCTGQTHFY